MQNFTSIDAEKAISNVDGWLSLTEGRWLYSAAKDGPGCGEIVEIGSWKGKSTIWLAYGSKSMGRERIHAIDHFKGDPECGPLEGEANFRRNIKNAGIEDFVVPIVMSSEDAANMWSKKPKSIRLLWIDGSHSYEDAKKDFLLWSKYVIDGGIIALHDTFWKEGPRKVVDDYIFTGNFRNIGFVDSITFATKSSERMIGIAKFKRDLMWLGKKYSPKRLIERY